MAGPVVLVVVRSTLAGSICTGSRGTRQPRGTQRERRRGTGRHLYFAHPGGLVRNNLLRHGVDSPVVLELLLCWNRVRCRPPLADEEVASVVESITRLHACD